MHVINSLAEWVYLFALGLFVATFKHEFARLNLERITLMFTFGELMYADDIRRYFHYKGPLTKLPLWPFKELSMDKFHDYDKSKARDAKDGKDGASGNSMEMKEMQSGMCWQVGGFGLILEQGIWMRGGVSYRLAHQLCRHFWTLAHITHMLCLYEWSFNLFETQY